MSSVLNRFSKKTAFVLTLAALTGLSACTHNPVTGEKAFNSFGQCLAANGVAAIGVGVLAKVVTGDTRAGVAAGAMYFLIAWYKCAQVYHSVENTQIKPASQVAAAGRNSLKINEFSIRAGTPGTDLVRTANYTLTLSDRNAKDIKVVETTTMLVPNLVTGNDGQTYYADSAGRPLRGANGQSIKVGQRVNPTQLDYKPYEFPREVTVQQGVRRTDGKIPTVADFKTGVPFKMRLTVAANGMEDQREQVFYFK